MAIVRLLHLSDLHIVRENRLLYQINGLSVYDPDALRALAQFVHVNRDAIDAILISGDIAHAGLRSDLSRAVEFFVSPGGFSPGEPWLDAKRKPTLKTFQKPIIVVPGNHDRYDGRLGLPNGKLFDGYFSSFWRPHGGAIQPFSLPDENDALLTIICADFTLETFKDCVPFGHWGQGMVYRKRLLKLIEHTRQINSTKPNSAIIWMLHFAPKFEDHCQLNFFMRLLDSDSLIHQAEKTGVQYLVCGHTHHYAIYKTGTNQAVKIHCAGTSACIVGTEDTSIHLLEIETAKSSVEKFRCVPLWWNPAQLIFQTVRTN
jgi:DNA repair exonuclease SbcCD nuclease subunit